MASILLSTDFITQLKQAPKVLIDVRSEGEFEKGHIPGAINLPLLSNEHRVIIGTTYKQSGREAAVQKGFELVGPKFSGFIEDVKTITSGNEIYLYCWRGGMRSNIMAWVLNLAGFKVLLLKGGYKTFRNWALQQFSESKEIIILGGKTGLGKTEILQELKIFGEQVIDLEALACHKGSAFGGLGQPPHPSQEQFENLLAWNWIDVDSAKVLWLENESRTIGKRKIPDSIYMMMRKAKVVEITRDYETRKKRILNEYGNFSKELLSEKTKAIAKRLGGLRLKQSLEMLENNDMDGWVSIILEYYDKAYEHSNLERDINQIEVINCEDEKDCKSIAGRILSLKEIKTF